MRGEDEVDEHDRQYQRLQRIAKAFGHVVGLAADCHAIARRHGLCGDQGPDVAHDLAERTAAQICGEANLAVSVAPGNRLRRQGLRDIGHLGQRHGSRGAGCALAIDGDRNLREGFDRPASGFRQPDGDVARFVAAMGPAGQLLAGDKRPEVALDGRRRDAKVGRFVGTQSHHQHRPLLVGGGFEVDDPGDLAELGHHVARYFLQHVQIPAEDRYLDCLGLSPGTFAGLADLDPCAGDGAQRLPQLRRDRHRAHRSPVCRHHRSGNSRLVGVGAVAAVYRGIEILDIGILPQDCLGLPDLGGGVID